MTHRGTFQTQLIWHDSTGGECNAEVTVSYVGTPGYPATREEPGEDDRVEITSISGDVPDRFFTDEWLIAECHEHWEADLEAAADFRADECRDLRMMGEY